MLRLVTLVVALFAAAPAFAQAFDAALATRAYLDSVPAGARAQSDAYFEGGYWLILWGALLAIAIDLALLQTRVAARLSAWTGRRRRSLAGRVLLFVLAYTILSAVLTLPWTIYTGHFRELAYDLTNQSLGQFLGDWAKNALIGSVIGAALFVPVFLLVRRTRAWWAWGGGVVAVVLAIGLVVAPVLILPLFNDYTPMPRSALQASIVSMARANGVPAAQVLVVDASRQSDRVSANVAGLGPTARIALNDNLLATRDPDGIRSVMGHEIGHYALNHVLQLLVGFTLIALGGLGLVAWAVPRMLRRWGERWRVTQMSDPAALPAAFIVLSLYGLAITPVTNSIIRENERQADLYGLNAARAPDGFARMALRLGKYRKLEPAPLEEVIFFDHPSGATRIRMAMDWKAENLAGAR